MVFDRTAPASDARPAQRSVHGRDGRNLPPDAGPDRRRARGGGRGQNVAARLGKSMGRRPLSGGRSDMTPTRRDTAAAGPRIGAAIGGDGGAPHIVVAGGGLAGVAAAIALCDGGARVTLAEARPRLGGATCSFTRGGLTIDNGQHIFLRCCTAYRGLLDRLGMTAGTVLQERFDVRVLTPSSGAARLRRRALPVPLHLAPALASYPLLSRTER